MEEPPTKRTKRTDSAAMWDNNDPGAAVAPRSREDSSEPKPRSNGREDRHRHPERRRGDDRRRKSRSRERRDVRRDRSKSNERSHRDRERDQELARDYPRDTGRGHDRERTKIKPREGGRDEERSRSRDRHKSSKNHPPSRPEPLRRQSRSRSPARNASSSTHTRSPPRGPRPDHDRHLHRRDREQGPPPIKADSDTMQVDFKPGINGRTVEGEGDEDTLLKKLMGFSSFKSTHNTKVPGNNISGIRKEKKAEYRQYMNRVGGFNRPLSPTR